MTQDEIIRMAREADIEVAHMKSDRICTDEEIRQQFLERFAALVAEATKEQCAKVCDGLGTTLLDDSEGGGAFTCAEAIRSME